MIVDILAAVCLGLAIFKGISKGFVVALCSLLAWIVGLAAALKLSALVAGYLGRNTGITGQWLPFVSFLIVFVAVVVLVRLLAAAIEKALQVAMLGWANRLAGVVLYALLYFTILSVLLFYAGKLQLLPPHVAAQSVAYTYIAPWGPWVMDMLGMLLPWFRNMFDELSHFFEEVAKKQAT
jgi:membrane protein required for colicin V production